MLLVTHLPTQDLSQLLLGETLRRKMLVTLPGNVAFLRDLLLEVLYGVQVAYMSALKHTIVLGVSMPT